jgi:hypothetical protein
MKKAMTKAAVLPNAVERVVAIFSKRIGALTVLSFMVNKDFMVKKTEEMRVSLPHL